MSETTVTMGAEPPIVRGYVRKFLCEKCTAGVHDPATHGELGCLETTDQVPHDYPCRCEERNYSRQERGKRK